MDAARAAEPEHFTTKAAMTDDGLTVLWHGDAGYEDGDASRPGPRHRLWMVDTGWRYERTAPVSSAGGTARTRARTWSRT